MCTLTPEDQRIFIQRVLATVEFAYQAADARDARVMRYCQARRVFAAGALDRLMRQLRPAVWASEVMDVERTLVWRQYQNEIAGVRLI